MTLQEAFESIREKLIEVPGLTWKIDAFRIRLQGELNDTFATFTPMTAAITIDDSYRVGKEWMISPHYSLNSNDTHYSTAKGMIKRLNSVMEKARVLLIADDVKRQAAAKARDSSLAKLKPYIDEYGEIFDVDAHGSVYLRYEGFSGVVDLKTETFDMASGTWSSNWVPLHMAIPFMKEVAVFRLLE